VFISICRYYCNGSTIDPNPTEGLCPVGNYCPEGSYQPTACPDGTIATSTGNDNLTDCELCKPGNYCTPASSKNGRFWWNIIMLQGRTGLNYIFNA
jgi:hypothetical protein